MNRSALSDSLIKSIEDSNRSRIAVRVNPSPSLDRSSSRESELSTVFINTETSAADSVKESKTSVIMFCTPLRRYGGMNDS